MGRLSKGAAVRVFEFLADLDDSKNYVRLYGAVKHGHIIDYELINGDRDEVKRIGDKHGLHVSSSTPLAFAGAHRLTVVIA